MKTDVTPQVRFGNNDDDCLPILKCVCGHEFDAWDFIISDDAKHPNPCEKCGALLYFTNEIRIYQVPPTPP